MQNLLKRGLIREYVNQQGDFKYHSGAVDITRSFQVIDNKGKISHGLYLCGVLTEGKLSLTYLAGISGTTKGALHDAERFAIHITEQILRNQQHNSVQPNIQSRL